MTSLSKHSVDAVYCFDLKNTNILSTVKNYKQKLFLEMIRIKQNSDSINFKTDIPKI